MLVSNKDYSNARVGDEKTDLVINSPFFYGGVPPGINMSALEVIKQTKERIPLVNSLIPLSMHF